MSSVRVYFAGLFSILFFVLGSVFKAASSIVEAVRWFAARILAAAAVLIPVIVIAMVILDTHMDGFEKLLNIIIYILIIALVISIVGVVLAFAAMLADMAVVLLRAPASMCDKAYASCLNIISAETERFFGSSDQV